MDQTRITPEQREKMIQEDMEATGLSEEELNRLQHERIWNDELYGDVKLIRKGEPVPKIEPVPMPQWPSDKAVSQQLGDPQ